MKTIVAILGGTGLLGRAISKELEDQGCTPVILSRNQKSTTGNIEVRGYHQDALSDVDAVINLAGDNIGTGRWTPRKKENILLSRTRTLGWLAETISSGNHRVRRIVSASASGYYGTITSDKVFNETDPPGKDFLAHICEQWEDATRHPAFENIPVALVRTGVVLSIEDGALPKLMLPVRFGLSMPISDGKQWIPWIHIRDVARLFVFLVRQPGLTGAFNAAAPEPVTNRILMKKIAQSMKRPFLPAGVPGFLLDLMLGEKAVITRYGSRIASDKISGAGFTFLYPSVDAALEHLIRANG